MESAPATIDTTVANSEQIQTTAEAVNNTMNETPSDIVEQSVISVPQAATTETVEETAKSPETNKDLPVPTKDMPETPITEAIFSGFMMYKKSSSTFPIFHKRYFFFSDEPVPIVRLQAFYEKHRKLKVDKAELDSLVAHAATSGKGLLFFSKTRDTVPSGIIECVRLTSVESDAGTADRFSIAYSSKQGFNFEAPAALRDGWVLGTKQKQAAAQADIEAVRASAVYQANLQAVQDGTAFVETVIPEGAMDVLSDDETPPAAEPMAQAPAQEKPKNRGSSLFAAIRDRLPHDKLKNTDASEEKADKSKPKRKSFLAGLVTKKEHHEPKQEELVEGSSEAQIETSSPVEVPTTRPTSNDGSENKEPAAAIAGALAALEANNSSLDVESTEAQANGSPKSPLSSPIKDRVDGFFNKLFKKSDKHESVSQPQSDAAESTSKPASELAPALARETEEAPQKAILNVDPVPAVENKVTEPVSTENALPAASVKQTEHANVEPEEINGESPAERKSIGRRLTSLFKGKRSTSASTTEQADPVLSPEPPKLPETAKVESEVREPVASAGKESAAVQVAEESNGVVTSA